MIIVGVLANLLYESQHIPDVFLSTFFTSLGRWFQFLAEVVNYIAAA